MTTPQITTDQFFNEAPASWNTRYITLEGYVCQITLRGESGKDLLDKANVAIRFLIEHGFAPATDNQRRDHFNKKDTKVCPIHQADMRKYERDGRSWYSHKVDGRWCQGKPEKE